eukprot:TRINITY_DN4133_c0_g1_i2.p1 TRINITY_DN4133_c0_g1~~TRINITY_DN4133_c0_g1_i2.p1  ORF type:complete len:509 (-),score=58.87 TRINITY_DN4133_c0_g1_i2:94-1620(-)
MMWRQVGRAVVSVLGIIALLSVTLLLVCSSPDVPADDSLFDYMYCYHTSDFLPAGVKTPLVVIWLLYLICLLSSTADGWFVPQLNQLALDLNLDEDVAGVTLLAFGNGIADVMTAVSAIQVGDLALTMGEYFGASNFILGVVLPAVLFVEKSQGQTVDRFALLRDGGTFLCTVILMLVTTWDGNVTLPESISFFVLYLLYVCVVVLSRRCRSGNDLGVGIAVLDSGCADSFGIEEASGTGVDALEGFGTKAEGPLAYYELFTNTFEFPFTVARHVSIPAAVWTSTRRRLAALCPLFCALLVLLSFCGGWAAFTMPLQPGSGVMWCVLIGGVGFIIVLRASSPSSRPSWHPVLLLGSVVSVVCWFNLLANELVAVLQCLGVRFGVPSAVLGCTVLAWGNSVGDLVADTALAKQGRVKTAVAGTFGSPLLSQLLGMSIGLSLRTSSRGPMFVELQEHVKIYGFFVVVIVLTVIIGFAVNRWQCSRTLACILLTQYACFMIYSVSAATTTK